MSREEFEESRRRFLEKMLAAGLYSASAGGVLLPAAATAMGKIPEELPDGKSIYRLTGNATVNGKVASEGTVIKPGDEVQTGDNSELVFVVDKDAFILRENSQLIIQGSGKSVDLLNLVKGKILSVFGKKKHRILTTTVTVGIRGTGIYVESKPDVSYVCTCYGVVDIESTKDEQSKETIRSSHHDAPRYILADANRGKKIETAPFKNHTDMELMLIETLVGRSVPFRSHTGYGTPRKDY